MSINEHTSKVFALVDLNTPGVWRWIWFVMAIVFASGELITPATFFFLPFAVGAAVASVLSFIGVDVQITWVVFLVVSIVSFGGFWKLGRKFDQLDKEQEGVGATRWIGQPAVVIETIEENSLGTIRLQREQWRAESLTGSAIQKGSTVVVTRIAGTRLVVVPQNEYRKDLEDTGQGEF